MTNIIAFLAFFVFLGLIGLVVYLLYKQRQKDTFISIQQALLDISVGGLEGYDLHSKVREVIVYARSKPSFAEQLWRELGAALSRQIVFSEEGMLSSVTSISSFLGQMTDDEKKGKITKEERETLLQYIFSSRETRGQALLYLRERIISERDNDSLQRLSSTLLDHWMVGNSWDIIKEVESDFIDAITAIADRDSKAVLSDTKDSIESLYTISRREYVERSFKEKLYRLILIKITEDEEKHSLKKDYTSEDSEYLQKITKIKEAIKRDPSYHLEEKQPEVA